MFHVDRQPLPILRVEQREEARVLESLEIREGIAGQTGVLGIDIGVGTGLQIININAVKRRHQDFLLEGAGLNVGNSRRQGIVIESARRSDLRIQNRLVILRFCSWRSTPFCGLAVK